MKASHDQEQTAHGGSIKNSEKFTSFRAVYECNGGDHQLSGDNKVCN